MGCDQTAAPTQCMAGMYTEFGKTASLLVEQVEASNFEQVWLRPSMNVLLCQIIPN